MVCKLGCTPRRNYRIELLIAFLGVLQASTVENPISTVSGSDVASPLEFSNFQDQLHTFESKDDFAFQPNPYGIHGKAANLLNLLR